MSRRVLLLIAAGLVVVAIILVPKASSYVRRSMAVAEQERVSVPPAEPPPATPVLPSSSTAISSASSESSDSSDSSLRASVNWNVPFTSQAPTGDWDELHGEACEEASALMAIWYFQGKTSVTMEDADRAIIDLVGANEALGYPVDDTAEQVAHLIRTQDSGLSVELVQSPSVDDLKELLSDGKLIIVPAQGQFLGNPYYKAPGPRYHMLVLRGYTDDGYVITNDPGTKRGEEYVYSWDVMMNAIHDWNGGEVESGQKVVVVVSRF